MEIQSFGDDRQLSHVGFLAAWMTADKIRYELLAHVLLAVDTVEDAFELLELLEGRLSHQIEHLVGSVFRRHLQSSAYMFADQLAGILPCCLITLLILAVVQQKVVAHTAADETLLYLRQGIHSMVNIQQGRVVGVQIRTDLRMDAGRTLAFLTGKEVATMHAVHVGRRTAQIAEVAFEVVHLGYLSYLF